jgi:hypothetical protein
MWLDKYDDLVGTGLSLSLIGVLSGTPLEGGPISFTAEVTDEESEVDQKVFNFTINPALSISTGSLPDWTVGFAYSQQLNAAGGTGSRSWSDKNSDLTGTGLTLSPSGLLAGTPSSIGPVSFTAEVTDQVGASDEVPLSFTINPALSITTTSLPEAELGYSYSHQLECTGGTAPLVWSDHDNGLDGTGLTLSNDGLLSGTPLAEGLINFTARVDGSAGSFDEMLYSFDVIRPYVCGDANGDDEVNVADGVYVINYVFNEGPAPEPIEAGDANCDGELNVADAVYIINYVFSDGDPPCCP